MMKLRSSLTVVLCLLHCVVCSAQSKAKPTNARQPKYQGLLWEISGNGLKKPSYLFGTMHVSAKLAFNLSDSFYYCIRNVDIVALETNPEELQEDFSQSFRLKASSNQLLGRAMAGRLEQSSFTINGYAPAIRAAFGYRPEMINHLLYRSYASREDYEEDTFLDMYIYQVGKRYGKRATGVENFQESEKLMMQAYRDAAKERRNRKTVSRTSSMNDDANTLTDAYRRGDLDMLDSISNNSYDSPAFMEKFLYRRNEIQANSIDSISRKESIFAGVGAAHLPGDRGVINLLRKRGYKVRPITVNNRDHLQKDEVEKLTAPVVFSPYTSPDKLIQLDIPGKLYNFNGISLLNQLQYADLANGAYYLVSRVKTNALALGQKQDDVLKKIDSLLYENIPGRIISKENITNNGYPGYDIQSRTRRGDLQRYQLFVTPFEVLVFKMSGNKDYAAGEEAKRFFSSIKLTPLPATRWTTFTAPSNLFSIQLPHTPHMGENGSRRDISKRTEYEALDKNTGNSYMVTVFNAPGNARLMEDSVEMGFAEESLQQSEFVKQQESRKFMQHRGYPCLEIVNLNNDLSHTRTRIILQGIHYYVISARYKKDKNTTQAFFDSFNPAVPQYHDFSEYKDSILLFTVKTPVKPADSEEQLAELMGVGLGEEDDEDRSAYLNTARTFSSDSTGEQVTVLYNRYGKYFHIKDSAGFWKNLEAESTNDGDMILALKKYERLPGYESLLITTRDTNCSRALMQKSFLKNNMLYTLVAVTDTLNGPSDFVRTFFETFTPADTANNNAIYTSKAPLLFKDFYSADSTTRKQARKRYMHVQYDDNDADTLIAMLNRWTPAEKNYLDIKTGLINELGGLKHDSILPWLRSAYLRANDTAALQSAILKAMLQQKTRASYDTFEELILKEIPIFTNDMAVYELTRAMNDSLELSATLFPQLLQMTALEDYKQPVYRLLATLVDSNRINPSAYASYVGQIAFEGRIDLQKSMIGAQEAEDDEDNRRSTYNRNYRYIQRQGNSLHNFAVLLLPYRQENKNAARFFEKYETTKDPDEQIALAILYLRNNLPVKDSLLKSLAGKDRYRATLWSALNEINRLDKFPAGQAKQADIARSLLYNLQQYNSRFDTIALVGRQITTYNFSKKTVYFFKYRQKDDTQWYMALSGPQPENANGISDDMELSSLTGVPLQDDKPVIQQFNRALKLVKYRGTRRYDYDMDYTSTVDFDE